MNLSEEFIITTDGSRNIILNQRVYAPVYKEADGKKYIDQFEATDRFKPIGYYSKLEHLYNGLLDRCIIESDIHSLDQVMETLKEVREHISEVAIMKQSELNKLMEG